MKKQSIGLNHKLRKKFNFGFANNYPFRTATIFAKNYFKCRKELIWVEIGVYKGEHALFMLEKLPIKKLYLIDPWDLEDYQKNKNVPKKYAFGLKNSLYETKKRLRKYINKVQIIKKYSQKAKEEIPNNIDFIYIDGDHRYDSVKKDIQGYYPKLIKEGIIAGHDIYDKEVARAVCEFVWQKKITEIHIKNMDWIIIKK